MKKLLLLIFLVNLFFSFNIPKIFPQDRENNPGRIPIKKTEKSNFNFSGIDLFEEGKKAYGWLSYSGQWTSVPVPEFHPFNNIIPLTTATFYSSGCFSPDGTFYMTDNGATVGILIKVNPFTGESELAGPTGDLLTGITYDWSTDTFFATDGDNLFTVDTSDGTTTLIGSHLVTGQEMIDIAADIDGNLYGYTTGNDNFYSINPSTGEATLIGPIGFDANYEQGLSFDYDTGILYMAAFNNSTSTGQFRSVDLATGTTTLIYDFGLDQMAPFAIYKPGFPAYGHLTNLEEFVSITTPAFNEFTTITSMEGYYTSGCFGPNDLFYMAEYYGAINFVDYNSGIIIHTIYLDIDLYGITYDYSTETFYGTNGVHLYSIDLEDGSASLIGSHLFQGKTLMCLATDEEGNLFGCTIENDNFYSIDSETGAATLIGSIGFDANYAQGLSFDFNSDILYMSAYNINTNTGQFRIVDVETGGSSLVYDFGSDQMAAFGINNGLTSPCPLETVHSPIPPNGETEVSILQQTISWESDPAAEEVKVFFGPAGNMSEVYSGSSINSFEIPSLDYHTTYHWKIDQLGIDEGCTNYGPVWTFTTEEDPYFYLFCDDFSDGLVNWEVTNDGGDCVWDIFAASEYDMPPEASGNVAAADADACGSGTTTITSLVSKYPYDATYSNYVLIEFDNDFRTIDSEDEAYVEVSTDGGNTWITVWSQIGESLRNTHEFEDITPEVAGYEFLLKFRSVQPGWDWWWAIDNVCVYQDGFTYPPTAPTDLTAQFNLDNSYVELNWQDLSSSENGFEIQRKLYNTENDWIIIDSVNANIESYIDNQIEINQTYLYRIRAFHLIYSGYSNIAITDTYIPVELTSFTANIVDNKVNLNWKTATELNNEGFEVQRMNGKWKMEDGKWEIAGYVEGNGTTSEEQTYTFVDDEQLFGKYKYRLKQIDYDGSYEYSNEVEVDLGMPKEFSLEQNYPNPFNPVTTIKFTIPETGLRSPLERRQRGVSTKLIVYDILGNEITTLVNEVKQPGIHEVEFDASNLSSGIYFYRLQSGDFVSTKKMILLR